MSEPKITNEDLDRKLCDLELLLVKHSQSNMTTSSEFVKILTERQDKIEGVVRELVENMGWAKKIGMWVVLGLGGIMAAIGTSFTSSVVGAWVNAHYK